MHIVVKMVETKDISEALKEMQDDHTVPKNIKVKLNEIDGMLSDEKEISMNVNKALDLLSDICDDVNIQPYVRTKIWNLVSMLEAL